MPLLNGTRLASGAVASAYAVAHLFCWPGDAALNVLRAVASAGVVVARLDSGMSTKSFAALTGWVIPATFCQFTGPTCWTPSVPWLYGGP